jgi:hypothetical protein
MHDDMATFGLPCYSLQESIFGFESKAIFCLLRYKTFWLSTTMS